MEFSPNFEETDSFEAIGYTWRGSDNSEIPPLWGHFDDKLGGLVEQSPSLASFGICRDMDESGAFSYMVGIAKSDGMNVSEGLEVWVVPGGRWAVFTTPLSNIHACYQHIMGAWSKDSGIVMRDGPTVERYPAEFMGGPEDRLDILVPVG